jgi:hypothetical protein
VGERIRMPVVAEQIVSTGGAHPELTAVLLPKLRRATSKTR